MRYWVKSVAALAAVVAIAAIAASAAQANLTLPTVKSATYPVTLTSNESTVATELQTPVETLKGKGFTLTMEIASGTTSEGTYTVLFTNVEEPVSGNKCSTSGKGAGEVEISKNKYKLVPDSLSPLGVAALYEVSPELVITCGSLKIHVKGNVLGLVKPINTKVAAGSTTLKGSLLCKSGSKGTPNESTYFNDEEKSLTAKLEANFGLGFEKACENVASEVNLTPNHEIEIAG